MKRIVLAILLASVFTMLYARSLVVALADGTEIFYRLGGEENPVLTFEGSDVLVNADHYAFANVSRFYVSETDADGVEAPEASSSDIRRQGSIFYVKTAATPHLYSIDGRAIHVPVRQSQGTVAVDIHALPAGAYILRFGNQSLKFLKRHE